MVRTHGRKAEDSSDGKVFARLMERTRPWCSDNQDTAEVTAGGEEFACATWVVVGTGFGKKMVGVFVHVIMITLFAIILSIGYAAIGKLSLAKENDDPSGSSG